MSSVVCGWARVRDLMGFKVRKRVQMDAEEGGMCSAGDLGLVWNSSMMRVNCGMVRLVVFRV